MHQAETQTLDGSLEILEEYRDLFATLTNKIRGVNFSRPALFQRINVRFSRQEMSDLSQEEREAFRQQILAVSQQFQEIHTLFVHIHEVLDKVRNLSQQTVLETIKDQQELRDFRDLKIVEGRLEAHEANIEKDTVEWESLMHNPTALLRQAWGDDLEGEILPAIRSYPRNQLDQVARVIRNTFSPF